jgi:Carbohydrate family 9 binding domain-like
MYRLHLIWTLAAVLSGAEGEALSLRAKADHPPDADPQSQWWRGSPAVNFEHGRNGEPVPGYRTEVRSRWTDQNLYFLFTCPYEQLYLKPGEPAAGETNKLWEWDVAEVFIGSNFENIRQYKEFEVSPRGEWIDLDIELDPGGKHKIDWQWNSAFEVKTRIDEGRKIWYVEMRIPFTSLAEWKPAPGRAFRANFYRIQGNRPRRYLAWQPVHQGWFHKPEAFGRLVLK